MYRRSQVIWIYLLYIAHMYTALAVSVHDFRLSDGSVAEKGNNISLKCDVTITDSDGLQILNVYKGPDTIGTCLLTSGFVHCTVPSGVSTRFSVSYSSPSMMILIRNVQISDGGNWYCGFQLKTNTLFPLTVYSSPVSVVLSGGKDGGDLQNKDVTLQCQTSNCVFPAPQVQWFYEKASSQWLLYKNVTPSGSQISCGDSEKKYSATLQLPRYTVWSLQPSNVETNVKFQCRLNFPTLHSPLQSAESGNVVFAVRVTAVTLKDGERNLTSSDTTETVVGRQTTYTCTPTTSRPAATIVWYIDGTEKQRSTSTEYMYSPAYEDNNKQIYCKAFNIPGETELFSSKPVLLVKVKVTSVTLHDGNISPGIDDEIIVTENKSKNLTCRTGNASPVPIIEWYFNNYIKQNGTNAKFIFTPTKSDHGKRIYCKAYNIYNIQPVEEAVISANPTLYVRVLAGTPTLTNWTSGIPEFLTGEQVTLTCKSTATRPAVSVVWKKGTSTLSNVQNTTVMDSSSRLMTVTSSVTFTPEKSDNSEVISCETLIPSQQPQTVQQRITVWWPPSMPSIPTSFPWLEGQNGKQLICESNDYGNPDAEVVWISTVGTTAAKVLNLPTLTKYHHRVNVTCQLKNIYTEKMNIVEKAQIILDVQYKPDVYIYINNVEQYSVERNEGQSLRAVCSAKGNPVPAVTWQDQSTGVKQLDFTDIDRKNHGGQRCIGQATSIFYPNYDFSNETTLQVTVNYAPDVTINLSNSNPTENMPLSIYCNAVGRPNVYTYISITQTWKKQKIREYNPHNGVLRINNVQLQDSGTYTCVVNNGIRDRNNQLNQIGEKEVMIKVSPNVLLDKMPKFPGAVGTSVNITVPFFGYPEIHTVTFKYQNGTEIKCSGKHEVYYRRQNVSTKFHDQLVELEGYIALLRINNEEVSDFANYTLTLENDVGPAKEWILEHVSESKPSAPVNLTYIGILNGVSTFSFVGGFNGGRTQTFIVETSVLGTENWIEQLRFNETDVKFHMDDKSTFSFNTTGLEANTYQIRVMSENSIGRIQENEAQAIRFAIEKAEISTGETDVGLIVGSLFAILVVIGGAVSVVIIFKRRFLYKCHSNGNARTKQGKELIEQTENSYYNLSWQDDSQEKAGHESIDHYETLQRQDKNKPAENYEMLRIHGGVQSVDVSPSPSSFVMKGATHDGRIYENLKLGGSN